MVASLTTPVTQTAAIAPATNNTFLRNHPFLQQFLAHYLDGVLIVSDRNEKLYANANADQICHQLCPEYGTTEAIPNVIKAIYSDAFSLTQSTTMFLGEAEMTPHKGLKLRIRAQRIEMLTSNQFCILIILEDQRKMLEQSVNNEVRKYNLTPREREIRLLYRLDYSYQEIAHELYITVNTVKKHLKSISMKRRQFLAWAEDE